MEGSVLEKILSEDPFTAHWYSGFAHPNVNISNSSMKKSKQIRLYVLNTDNSYGPGKHWCLAIFHPCSKLEFFDSLGFHPKKYGFDKTLLENISTLEFNDLRVQSLLSSTCGHHCLYYALKRARGFSAKSILNSYNPFDFSGNDKKVYYFIYHKYGPISAKISPL